MLAQKGVAFSHNPLRLGFALRVIHHEVQGLLIDVGEESVKGALDVVEWQQKRRFWL